MIRNFLAVCLFAAGTAAAPGSSIPGDSARGSELIRSQGCILCHRIGGEGGTTGPDLGKARGRNYTPSSMASTMWNHAPAMWSSMESRGTAKPVISEAQAGDLFAYFQSIRFFERPGDAGRGKQVFTASHCAECHGRTDSLAAGAPPIASWKSISSPIVFAQQMWNHAPEMERAMAGRKMKWTRLTGMELNDILVYVQSLPETRGRAKEFSLASTGKGAELFKEKGCRNCHQGKLDLDRRLVTGTVTDFAVAMWNHAPEMAELGRKTGQAPPKLEAEDMRDLLTYFWDRQIMAERGNPAKGAQAFSRKGCANCHGDAASGAPDLKQWRTASPNPVRPFSMTAVLWQHGPAMLAGMKAKQMPWPVFSQTEMLDLIAYLNSLGPVASAVR